MAQPPLHDRDGLIWMDGEYVPWREATIHLLSHSLHYSSSVFEGVRAYHGNIFKLAEHTKRLIDSANMLEMNVPFTQQELENAQIELLEKQNLKDAYIRPIVWRGSEQLAIAAKGSKVHVGIAAWEWPSYYSMESRLKGLKLHLSPWHRPAPDTAPTSAKAAGLYMICTMSKEAVERKGYDDALMYDYRGYLAEATSANLFLVMDGELHTPLPDCFLNGITRQTVIELAEKRGIKMHVRHIKPEELKNTQEIFLTGTAAEVSPVGQIDGTELGPLTFTVGDVTKQLMEDYTALVNQ